MRAIYKREFKSYFTSMTGYIFIAFFIAVIGLFFYANNLISGNPNFGWVIYNVSFLFMLLIPILTMRIMAEEKKQKTDQLLLTSPITPSQIVFGKYLSVLTIYMIVIAIISTFPLILNQFGEVPFGLCYSSILGFSLLGASLISIGLFISSLVDSQIVASVITFITILITYFIDSVVRMLPTDHKSTWIILAVIFLVISLITYILMKNTYFSLIFAIICEIILAVIYFIRPILFDGLVVRIANWFSVMSRYNGFSRGVINISDMVYYISLIFVFLFLTVQSIKKRRWN